MVDHVKPVMRDQPDHIIFHVGTNDIPSDKDAGDIAKSLLTWPCLQNLQPVMSRFPTSMAKK